MLIYFAIGKCEEDETKTHKARSYKVEQSVSLALYQDPPDQDRYQFTTFKDDLKVDIDVAVAALMCL